MCAPKSHYEGLIQLYQQAVLRRNVLIPIPFISIGISRVSSQIFDTWCREPPESVTCTVVVRSVKDVVSPQISIAGDHAVNH